jgi:hypothetical protein
MKNTYRILMGKTEENRIGRPRRSLMDNIKMDLRDIGRGGIDWIYLTQDRDEWRALVSRAINIRVP